MGGGSIELQTGINTLSLSTYNEDGFSGIMLRNADGTGYRSDVSPGVVQYGDSEHEYVAPWELSEQFYMEGNVISVSQSAFINAVIFGQTYQVRFE